MAEYSRNIAPEKLELLVTVVKKEKASYYVNVIQSYEVNLHIITLGKGTSKMDILNYLGLSDPTKAVIFSVVRGDKAGMLMEDLDQRFHTVKDGKGIAFTVPFTSVIGTLTYGFLSNDKRTVKEEQS